MADKGIIFSAPMVRALLDGRKTQTRRLAKPRGSRRPSLLDGEWSDSYVLDPGNAEWLAQDLPYRPGDRLYVREAWNTFVLSQDLEVSWPTKKIPRSDPRPADGRNPVVVDYAIEGLPGTDAGKGPWRPSIHMPRWASRLWLNVTDVRVERLQEISEADARAEGIAEYPCEGPHRGLDATYWSAERGHPEHGARTTPVSAFGALWNSLHTKPGETWEDNPWIYATSFGVNLGNIDQAAPVTAGAGAAIDG